MKANATGCMFSADKVLWRMLYKQQNKRQRTDKPLPPGNKEAVGEDSNSSSENQQSQEQQPVLNESRVTVLAAAFPCY